MKCLDQNGVKYLWNCIFNNAVSKSDVDLSANVNSLNPISNNAVCNHIGSIADSLRNSKADYETGTWTPVFWKGIKGEQVTPQYVGGCMYAIIGDWVYLTASVIYSSDDSVIDSITGVPVDVHTGYTPAYTSGLAIHGSNIVAACRGLASDMIVLGSHNMSDFTLCGWIKYKS